MKQSQQDKVDGEGVPVLKHSTLKITGSCHLASNEAENVKPQKPVNVLSYVWNGYNWERRC